MRLAILHPEVAWRSCDDCKLWIYDHKTGKKLTRRNGVPQPRPKGTPLPCHFPDGCAKGTPETSRALSRKNLQAYEHYQQCKATGQFPDDPIVRRNAGIIREVEDSIEASDRRFLIQIMLARSGSL